MAKCKNCINLDRQGWCEKAVDSPEPNRERECYYFQRMTNADRIRGMSDEELADKWWAWIDCGECPARPNCSMLHKDCNQFALEWLKKEVEE